jgi:hypothetical protein
MSVMGKGTFGTEKKWFQQEDAFPYFNWYYSLFQWFQCHIGIIPYFNSATNTFGVLGLLSVVSTKDYRI